MVPKIRELSLSVKPPKGISTANYLQRVHSERRSAIGFARSRQTEIGPLATRCPDCSLNNPTPNNSEINNFERVTLGRKSARIPERSSRAAVSPQSKFCYARKFIENFVATGCIRSQRLAKSAGDFSG